MGDDASPEDKHLNSLFVQFRQDGSEWAFDELFSALHPKMCGLIRVILGNYHDAEDVALKAWDQVALNQRQWEESRGKVSNWVLGIARNAAIDHLRKKKTKKEKPLVPLDETTDAEVVRTDSSVLAEIARKDVFAAIDKILESGLVTSLDRQAFEIIYLSDESPEVLATMLGTTPKAIKQRAYRVCKFIEHQLRKNHFEKP